MRERDNEGVERGYSDRFEQINFRGIPMRKGGCAPKGMGGRFEIVGKPGMLMMAPSVISERRRRPLQRSSARV